MSEIHDEKIEKIDEKQPDSGKPLSIKGINSVQGEFQAYQDDLEKYDEQLFEHKTRMNEIGNKQAADETEEEIRLTNKRLYETVQKKHGIEPDQEEIAKE